VPTSSIGGMLSVKGMALQQAYAYVSCVFPRALLSAAFASLCNMH
jgi:hypothetical protein